jgi:hypothetical protein
MEAFDELTGVVLDEATGTATRNGDIIMSK